MQALSHDRFTERFIATGMSICYAGENVALHWEPQGAMDMLMESNGHRQNILQTLFTHVGIGWARCSNMGDWQQIWTQMFARVC